MATAREAARAIRRPGYVEVFVKLTHDDQFWLLVEKKDLLAQLEAMDPDTELAGNLHHQTEGTF